MSLQTPPKIRKLQRKLYLKAKNEPEFRFYALYDKVYRDDILLFAFGQARSNAGAPGVDGVTFEQIEVEGLGQWLEGLQQELKDQTYKPDPVRRVNIPKPGGGLRPLGIPTIRDRVVQTAAKLLLEPIFEADFTDDAFGYRPRRSAQDAVVQVVKALRQGYTDVVDADVSRYFDTIPHAELIKSVARRVSDPKMLRLVKMWLKAPIEETDDQGKRRMSGGKGSSQGVPQGGVISPLLANIYMQRFLRAWHQRDKGRQYRARIVNYADDFVILSRGKTAEAMEWTQWAMGQMGLCLNEAKTRLVAADKETFDFLGFTLGPKTFRRDGSVSLTARPSKKSIKRVKAAVRRLLVPSNVGTWPEISMRLNRMLTGWTNYFSHGSIWEAYRAVDLYVYDRVRHFLRRRHKVSSRGTRVFPAQRVYGQLGVVKLEHIRIRRRSTALR